MEEDIPVNPEISPSDNKYIDELTMKLLTNQTNYAKYLYKNDNEKFEEQQQFIFDCNEFYNDIMHITKTLCKQKDHNFGSDVKEAFETYATILIRYLEVKKKSDEMQKEFQENNGEEEFPDSIEEEEKMNDYMLHPKKGTMDMFVKKK